ncbi:hypothetical protein [Bradyrhizobium sp.]|uniref:hypothetical protein n=1 Tax=Bradyrhizobium sp. TaxID=376 RepID=UPI001DC08DBA|nr:hypothetical protein [Bradyrhizobium sp.]MBI5318809.1 hypothetical protein [Bradyrhizobium sp.]
MVLSLRQIIFFRQDRPQPVAMTRRDWMHVLSLVATLALAVGAICIMMFAM